MLKVHKILLYIIILSSFIIIGEGEVLGLNKMTEVRYWTAPDHTRVVFDLDSKVGYKVLEPTEPKVIEFELPSVKNLSSQSRIAINDGLIKSVSLTDERGNLKVRLELEEKASFNLFFLAEYLYKPNRIVIDVIKPGVKEQIGLSQKDLDTLLREEIKIVVIDPGHGGEDPGAIGRTWRLKEKDMTLDIARRLAKILNDHSKVRAFLTRSGDYFIPLRERTAIARRYKADLFVSLHCNASHHRCEKGSSVYVLSLKGATDEASKLLAERENAADMIGGVNMTDDTLTMILLDLTQTATLNESLALAQRCMDSIASLNKTENDGVKRAGFVVLKAADIPSILVETAFISNRREEALLKTSGFRQDLARAISRGILEYLELEKPLPALVKLADNNEEKSIPIIKYHTVKKGETLFRISKTYNVPIRALCEANNLSRYTVYVGQRLIIPE